MSIPTLKMASIIRRMRSGVRELEKRQKQTAGTGGIQIVANGIQFPFGAFQQQPKHPKAEKKPDGIEISADYRGRGHPHSIDDERESLQSVVLTYPLIPQHPKKGEPVYAYANIRWQGGEMRYTAVEPVLQNGEKTTIETIKRDLEERLDVDFTKLGDIKAKQIIRQEIKKSFSIIPDVSDMRKMILTYYIERDLLGLGKIEALMNDEDIEDISCDGVGIPLYVYHRDPKFASIKTNIMFDTADELNIFVGILSQKCNKSISIAEPLLDGTLPNGSRVQATLGTDIARKGSNFTIRKFTERPLTPTHMLKFKTLNAMELAYLWLAVENGKSILVSGGTATGKTSLLNALSLFIRPALKVVSIEDTSELRLSLPHWIPQVARAPLSLKGTIGEVTLFDLLKTSLRQRPDYIIVGEVRGREAFVLFQQMATGHPAMATIHAATIPQLIDRLITPPISLPPSLLENIDIVVFLTLSRLKGSYVRRTDNIMEVVGVEKNRPKTLSIFKWKPISDTYEIGDKSVVLKKISERMGITEDTVKDELAIRKKILEWMLEQGIFDYREVARVISTYYTNPERVMSAVDAGSPP